MGTSTAHVSSGMAILLDWNRRKAKWVRRGDVGDKYGVLKCASVDVRIQSLKKCCFFSALISPHGRWKGHVMFQRLTNGARTQSHTGAGVTEFCKRVPVKTSELIRRLVHFILNAYYVHIASGCPL